MDRDRITRTGARTPGVERQLARMAALKRATAPDTVREEAGLKAMSAKEGCKPAGARDNWAPYVGKAPPERPTLKPYRGKPAVRNFRGDDGNVGIIRSPIRAIALPDNRHEAENERVSRERSSDPLGLESCVATVRDPTKRGQRIGGVGIQLRKDAIRTPTSL